MKWRCPCSTTLYPKVNTKSARKCTPTDKCSHEGMFKNVHSTRELEILPYRNKEWRQPDIGKTSNDARIITLKLNPSWGTVLPAPHGKGNKCDFTRTRQIIRYWATAILRRLQIKQYTASNEGGDTNRREHPKILIKYAAVHPTAVSENYSTLGMQKISKFRTRFIRLLWYVHIPWEWTKWTIAYK